jgi:hypothetical protein
VVAGVVIRSAAVLAEDLCQRARVRALANSGGASAPQWNSNLARTSASSTTPMGRPVTSITGSALTPVSIRVDTISLNEVSGATVTTVLVMTSPTVGSRILCLSMRSTLCIIGFRTC